MDKQIQDSINYLRAPADYFWQWAENGNVIEWKTDGTTICYQEVLFVLLKQLQLNTMPRMGPFLLVLHACQHRFGPRERYALLKTIGKFEDRALEQKVEVVEGFLRSIHDLPIELRTGPQRLLLLRELFGLHKGVLDAETFLQWEPELDTGRWNPEIMEFKEEGTINLLRTDINYFDKLRWQFPNTESLETVLRTGIKLLPAPAKIELSESTSTDLLDQLLEDPKTAGISRIARSLLPVINIPMHSLAAGDQPIGGISDITNRGSYDKLLLSELAQDELLLTARLVNNEALYFRREEPPQHPQRRKILLIDSTIKMWGMPRVFAMSAALAFARNSKHGEEIEAYVLGATVFEQVILSEKKGVINAMERMHHGLHAGDALALAIGKLSEAQNEIVLITEEKQLQSPAFHASFDKVRQQLSFLILLNRNGHISFSECTRGRSKLLNEAKLDLADLLFQSLPKRQKNIKSTQPLIGLPAFLTKTPLPLLVLKKRIQPGCSPIAANTNGDIVVVNKNQRVLFFMKGSVNAIEMLTYIEPGTYTFHWSDPGICFILVQGDRFAKLYQFKLNQESVQSCEIFDDLRIGNAFFLPGRNLYLISPDKSIVYDCSRMQKVERVLAKNFDTNIELKNTANAFTSLAPAIALDAVLKTQNFYSVSRFDRVYISQTEELVLGNFSIDWGQDYIQLSSIYTAIQGKVFATPGKETFFNGTKCKYRTWTWSDGSEAIVDKRGILHLRSSDPGLAEVSIILVHQVVSACWSSENEVCGNDSFINYGSGNNVIPPAVFFNAYIQPFINHIINHAAKP